MFNDSEWTALINKLRQLTEARKINWVSNGMTALYVEVGPTTYLLDSKDGDGVAPYVLSLRTGTLTEWQEIDSLESRPGHENEFQPATKVAPLFELALRMSKGGPEIVQDLLAALNEIDSTEPPKYGDEVPF